MLRVFIIHNGLWQTKNIFSWSWLKPTVHNTLLRADSDHPRHLKNTLPFNQLCRVKHICQTPKNFIEISKEIMTNFKKRGYNQTVLNDAATKCNQRSELLKTKNKVKSNNKIIFSTEYSRNSVNVKSFIN